MFTSTCDLINSTSVDKNKTSNNCSLTEARVLNKREYNYIHTLETNGEEGIKNATYTSTPA